MAALRFGSLLHCLALEPEKFWQRYLLSNTHDNKAAQAKIAADRGLILVKREDYDKACAMSTIIRNLPLWQAMQQPQSEVIIQWQEQVNGLVIPCKAKVDRLGFLPNWGLIPLELKSTRSAHPARFAKDILHFGYHISAAWYVRGLQAIGHDVRTMVLLAMEKQAPYPVLPVEMSPELLQQGWLECEMALDQYAYCVADNYWPGYANNQTIII